MAHAQRLDRGIHLGRHPHSSPCGGNVTGESFTFEDFQQILDDHPWVWGLIIGMIVGVFIGALVAWEATMIAVG
jgi:hypothetical protein